MNMDDYGFFILRLACGLAPRSEAGNGNARIVRKNIYGEPYIIMSTEKQAGRHDPQKLK